MASWKIYNLKSGEIAVVTPYNPTIVAESKRRMGRFIELTLADGKAAKAWKLDASHREAMEALCRQVFDSTDMVERVITWSCPGGSYYAPTLDGYELYWLSRDSHSFKRFDAGMPIKIIEVMRSDLYSGGSRNNPKLFGSVTLRVRCRAAAEAGGQGWTVEVE